MDKCLKMDLPQHPCMNDAAHNRIARIHLPVAKRCNIECGFCERKTGIQDISIKRPGYCDIILTPDEAVKEAESFLMEFGDEAIIGIAGPGDPLANPETFETLEKLNQLRPKANLCLCTNGLNLPSSVELLKKLKLKYITVTVNAVAPEILKRIHSRAQLEGVMFEGSEASEILNKNQMEGIRKAIEAGMYVKVNTVVIPDVNYWHVTEIAKTVSELGVRVLNLMPMIPGGRFSNIEAPTRDMMNGLFKQCESYIRVFRSCGQCRADARGIPGKEDCTWKKTA